MSAEDTKKKLTVFKSDRHEDVAACMFAGLAVIVVLSYMAFFIPTVVIKAPVDGKLTEIKVNVGDVIKEGQPLYVYETKKKKYVQGQMQETTASETFKSKTPGKVLAVKAKAGDAFKKGGGLLEVEHVKGTLP